jgi:hypothetical protein
MTNVLELYGCTFHVAHLSSINQNGVMAEMS